MTKTPAELYSKLLTDYHLSEHLLCELHKPCNRESGHRCSSILKHKVIDFDKVKTEFHRGLGSPKASTDGFTFKNDLFCFVELKGWADFLVFHSNSTTLKQDIENQVNKYDLNKKFTDSMLICKEIAQNELIFKDAQIAFILVTDIDVKEDGTMELYSDLMSLAETSTNWSLVCNRELKGKLSTLPSGVNTYYIKCQEFDNVISKL